MPNMADLALLSAAGEPVVGTKLTPSAGDTVPAQWRVEFLTVPPFARTTLNIVARSNAKRDVRRVSGKIAYPFTVGDTNTGQRVMVSMPPFSFELVVGTNVDTVAVDNLVSFISSYFNDPLIVASLKSQIAPT